MRRFFAVVLAALLLSASILPAQADNLAPKSNEDLLTVLHAANLAQRQAAACRQIADSGSQCQLNVPCQGATDLVNSLDNARTSLAAMQPRLQQARKDALLHFQSLQSEYVHNLKNDAAIQKAQAYSKFASDFSKLMFDAASIIDGVQSINDIVQKLKDGDGLNDLDQAILKAKFADQSWEFLAGSQNTIDDLRTAMGKEGKIPPDVAKVLTVKGGASDVFGALTDFRDKYNELQKESLVNPGAFHGPNPAHASGKYSAFRASAKSVGQLLGKVGAWYSDKQQAALMDELAENGRVEGALDQASAAAFADYQRLVNRELALEQALDAIRKAYQLADACAAKCPGSLAPAPVPDTSAMSYGEALKQYHTKLPSLAQDVSAKATAFKPKPCDEKPAPKGSAASKPEEQPKCPPREGGLAGAINDVAAQEKGCRK